MNNGLGKQDMNIAIGLIVFIAALYMRFKYREQGQSEKALFAISMFAGLISILTIESYATFWQMLWPVIDITLCTLILFCYRAEIKRQAAARSAQRAKVRKEAVRAIEQRNQQAHLLSRASILAMCEYTENITASENAA